MDRLQSMRVFEKVVDEGGFAAAARALDMSAPVVTRLVADLEDHLGTRLLQRSTRRLALTEAGQNYLNRVRHILQDIDEAHAAARAETAELAGTLRLHAPAMLASYVLAPLLAGFRQRYPKITFDIEVATPNELSVEDYDLTLLPTDQAFDADIVARKLVDSDMVLVASPEYLKRRGTPKSPQELSEHDCIRLRALNARPRAWRLWLPDSPDEVVEVEITPVVSANHTDTLLRATLDGAGIASAAVDLAAAYLARGELVRVLPPWISGQLALYAALPSRKFVPQRTRVFLDYLIEQSRELQARALAACAAACAAAAAKAEQTDALKR